MTEKRISKTFSKSILTLGLALGFAAQVSNAAIVISFAQVGDDVIATASGEILVGNSGLGVNPDVGSGDHLEGATNSLLGIDEGENTYDVIAGAGAITASGLSQNPDSFTGHSFGYRVNATSSAVELIWDPDIKNFEGLSDDGLFQAQFSVSPDTTWTWENTTLAAIGLGSLTTTEQVVYTDASLSSADTISFVATVVPEPSSSLMLALGGVGMLLRRRR